MLAWLLEGDVAVAYQARRDLLGDDDADLRRRIAREGDGAVLLAARNPDGRWGRDFYQPKLTCTHYTLLELKNLGLPPDEPAAVESTALVLREHKARDGGLNPQRVDAVGEACVTGMGLAYAAYFGATEDDLASLVDFLLGQRLDDGGFNCRLNRTGARHSSVHTTISVVEGITAYDEAGRGYRRGELLAARASAVELLLRHRLYRSERTSEPIQASFTRLHHPARWHYDVLRALDAFVAAGVPHDPRMDDALQVIRDRRRPDGRWSAATYPGETHLPRLPGRTASPWATLIALRVQGAYGRTRAATRGDPSESRS